MPEHINWSAVFQSVKDTWLPLFAGIGVIIVIVIIVKIIKKHKDKNNF